MARTCGASAATFWQSRWPKWRYAAPFLDLRESGRKLLQDATRARSLPLRFLWAFRISSMIINLCTRFERVPSGDDHHGDDPPNVPAGSCFLSKCLAKSGAWQATWSLGEVKSWIMAIWIDRVTGFAENLPGRGTKPAFLMAAFLMAWPTWAQVAKKAAVHGIPPSGGFQEPETAKFATAQQKDAERQSPAILYFCMAIFFGKLWLLGALQIALCGTYLDEPPASWIHWSSLRQFRLEDAHASTTSCTLIWHDLAMDNRYGIPSSCVRCEKL